MKPKRVLPPTYLFMSIVAEAALWFAIPVKTIIVFPWNLLGALPLALGIALNLAADRTFSRHKTTVNPFEKSTALITSGAFRISRHPMYLGFVLILAGIAVLMGSLTPYFVVIAFAIFMDVVFITAEEKMLEEIFGEAWLKYKSRVRRWI
jgi:protein-S-isoprenylcysteine O-methyltransferase Ste14